MAARTTAEVLADALRQRTADVFPPHDSYEPSGVEVDGESVLFSFRLANRPVTYVVRLGTGRPLVGVSTGEICETPDQWAIEVTWRVAEEAGTRGLDSLPRTVGPDGTVQLVL